jgi:hypothetical protein
MEYYGLMLERNKKITCLVLNGSTLESAGYIYGITRERVRQIITSIVRKADLDTLVWARGDRCSPDIQALRRTKDTLIPLINSLQE